MHVPSKLHVSRPRTWTPSRSQVDGVRLEVGIISRRLCIIGSHHQSKIRLYLDVQQTSNQQRIVASGAYVTFEVQKERKKKKAKRESIRHSRNHSQIYGNHPLTNQATICALNHTERVDQRNAAMPPSYHVHPRRHTSDKYPVQRKGFIQIADKRISTTAL